MPVTHTKEVKLLIELQSKDSLITEIKSKIELFPKEIGRINEEFEDKKNAMEAAKGIVLKIRVEKKDKEILAAQKDEDIRKHQRELNLVKDNNAFKALLTEIDRDKKEKDDVETEILTLLEEEDKAVIEEKKNSAEFQKNEEEKNSKIKEIEKLKEECEIKLSAVMEERDKFAVKISEDILSNYDYLREKRGIAIIEVKEDKEAGKFFCGGCRMVLVPQRVVDVKKKDCLVVCDSCQRMIYLKRTVFETGDDNEIK